MSLCVCVQKFAQTCHAMAVERHYTRNSPYDTEEASHDHDGEDGDADDDDDDAAAGSRDGGPQNARGWGCP